MRGDGAWCEDDVGEMGNEDEVQCIVGGGRNKYV